MKIIDGSDVAAAAQQGGDGTRAQAGLHPHDGLLLGLVLLLLLLGLVAFHMISPSCELTYIAYTGCE
jgi:hypothetical protein